MPAAHTGLNVLSPGLATSVPCKKVATSLAGIRKLNPCTMAPPDAESVTATITPTSAASALMPVQGRSPDDAAELLSTRPCVIPREDEKQTSEMNELRIWPRR